LESDEESWLITPGSSDELSLRIANVPLAPGWYEISFTVGIPPEKPSVINYAQVLTLKVRSSGNQKIHALRTLRVQDFANAPYQTLHLRLGLSGERNFVFQVRFSDICPVYVVPRFALMVTT
jgi:hypothetical protein